jgi:hypothetical protein
MRPSSAPCPRRQCNWTRQVDDRGIDQAALYRLGKRAGECTASEPRGGSTEGPTADDVCHALEHSAAENALAVEFFARVIWQEGRFGAQTVRQEGAEGIAQFMPATGSRHGLADPFGRKLTATPPQFCFRAISDFAR